MINMKAKVRYALLPMIFLTVHTSEASIVSAQASSFLADVERVDKVEDDQAIHFIDENDPLFNEVFYYLGVDEELDKLMFENFPLLTVGVTKKYTDASLIPETIYYNSYGYTGYIPKVSQDKQTAEGFVEVVYIGVVFRNGPTVTE